MAITIEEQVALAPLTTMRTGGAARFFVRVCSVGELEEAVEFALAHDVPCFILGGGSNTLIPDDGFDGLVIKIELEEVVYEETRAGVRVIAGAGVKWDAFVQDVVARGLWGVENLSLVPGTVGGAAVQNIGAYGVEAKDTIAYVEAFDTLTKKIKRFTKEECAYGYRESIFKKDPMLVVVRVAFDLKRDGVPNVHYEDVKKYFEGRTNQQIRPVEERIEEPALGEIRDAIIAIRTAKMPAPPLGTAGSFFKNPVVTERFFEELRQKYPEIKAYIQSDGTVKLSAAWLLDHVGNFRGVRRGDAGVHEKQALILVNYGTARTKDILDLARAMKNDINERTGVVLEEEVVIMEK